MRIVGAYEAKTHLPSLLDRVAGGERITITKHGRPVAMLVPPEGSSQVDLKQAVAEFKEFRKGMKLRGLSIKKLINEGRR